MSLNLLRQIIDTVAIANKFKDKDVGLKLSNQQSCWTFLEYLEKTTCVVLNELLRNSSESEPSEGKKSDRVCSLSSKNLPRIPKVLSLITRTRKNNGNIKLFPGKCQYFSKYWDMNRSLVGILIIRPIWWNHKRNGGKYSWKSRKKQFLLWNGKKLTEFCPCISIWWEVEFMNNELYIYMEWVLSSVGSVNLGEFSWFLEK